MTSFYFKNTLIIKQTKKKRHVNQASFFTVSTAWICLHTNHLKTWERNSSWLWRTHKASRASTKTSHFSLHPTNQRGKKKRKQNATQRCQTSCCSSSVQACCTVMPDCEPHPQHGDLRLYSELSSQHAYSYIFSVWGDHSSKCQGGKRTVESQHIYRHDW